LVGGRPGASRRGRAQPLLEPLVWSRGELISFAAWYSAFLRGRRVAGAQDALGERTALITFQVSELGLQRFGPLAVIGSVTSDTGEV